MAFITSHNDYKIVHRNNLKTANLTGDIYKWKIYIFSKYEEQSLLAIQELMKNPEKYFTEIYDPIYIFDSKKYVYKEQQPAYHLYDHCERLHADFSNFELPQEIKDRGDDEIERFRKWFKENSYDLGKDPARFSMRLQLAFKISINPKSINYENSGGTDFSNVTVAELENSIDNLLRQAGRFYYASEKNTRILYQFGKISSIAFTDNPLKCNNTNYSDDEVKEFLKDYHRKFKLPLMAIEELEAWYFGDWEAVLAAYPRASATISSQAKYRNPDEIAGGTWEAFERVLQKAGYYSGGLRKVEAARAVATQMEPSRNTSPSFCTFRDVLREMASA